MDVLHAAFNWGMIRGELERNPVALVKSTLVKRIQKLKNRTVGEADVSVLSLEEQGRFEKEAISIDEKTGKLKYPAGLYGLLLLYTGMRVGEMLALRWDDVDWFESADAYLTINKNRSMAKNRNKKSEEENNYIMVEGTTKNEKARKIKLTQEAKSILLEIMELQGYAAPKELIVKTRNGTPNTATNLEHRMKVIFHNAGLTDLTGGLHIFRRTFATRLYENGARVKEIAAYIGDLESTTEHYYIAARRKMGEGDSVEYVVSFPLQNDQENI